MIANTKLVRTLMQASGKRYVYTNLYENCRTVKCYSATRGTDADMLDNIRTVLSRLNIPFTIKFTKGARGSYGGGPAIIVRLPL